MLFQNWLKTLVVVFARRTSGRDRRKTRSASGQVGLMRDDFVCTQMVETLETRKLLSVDPVLVADLVAGSDGSFPSNFVDVNGTLFFTASDNTNGVELWRSDGTSTGTTFVNDILPGIYGSNPNALTNVNGTLFFRANDGTNGYELWQSDGTSAGTTLVKDIFGGGVGSVPRYLTNVNGTLFFNAFDNTNDRELWKSDGTSAGTTLVKDIFSGTNGSAPYSLTNVNGKLFFGAYDGVNGYGLWQSDGTSAGTTLVKDITVGSSGASPRFLTNVNGKLFFGAADDSNNFELWQSDGTSAGTTLVKDINTGIVGSYPRSLTNVNGTLFFTADDGVSSTELWQSDGTSAGTTLVKDIFAGGSHSFPRSLTNVNGSLFFSATDGVSGYELWQSDGTSTGTTLASDIRTGSSSSNPSFLTNVNGALFFSANDGTNGVELWKADVPADTPKVRVNAFSFLPPALVKDITSGSSSSLPLFLTNVNGTLFFSTLDGVNGNKLWRSDGTSAGTTLVKAFSGNTSGTPSSLTNVNGTLFFSADGGVNGTELWQSDGTSAGTTLVKDIYSGSSSSNPGSLTNVNGTLFFSANDGTIGTELWRSDGTSAGTTLVKDIRSGSGHSVPVFLTNVNGTLFFSADDGVNGIELWQSDGTSAGTTLVKDVYSGIVGSYPRFLTNVNGTLFFSADDDVSGNELWQSDGTDAGTTLVKDILSGYNNSIPRYLANVNGTLFFSAYDGANGDELWQSDGTSAGTTLVKDIRSGSSGSSLSYLTNVNGTLFFRANDGTTGIELWQSDGTSAGTTLVKDIRSGSSSSSPGSLTNVNGTLFFNANDGTTGRELWSMPVNSIPVPVITAPPAATPFQRPTIIWTAVNGAVKYQVWIRNASTNVNPFFVTVRTFNAFYPTSDFGIGRYNLWIRAISATGDSSADTPQYNFTINTPAVFTSINPIQTTATPTLNWVALPGAVNYDVWIDNLSTNQSQFVRNMNVVGTSFTPPSNLPMGSYRAWVRGKDASGLAAQWAVPVNFQVLLPVTVPAAPPSTFDRTPTFAWTAVPGAFAYNLVVRNANTGVTVLVPTGITGTSFTPVTNLPVNPYRWQVIAVAKSGLKSQSATTQNLYVGGKVTLLTPSGSTSDTTPTFTWTPVTDAATYDVFVTRTDVLTAGIINQTGRVGTSFTPVTPLPVGTYRAWVRAISTTAEVGPWSLQVNFSIAAETSEPGSGSENLLRVQLAGLNNNSLNCDQLSSPVEAVDDVVSQEILSVPGDMSIPPKEPASIHSTAMPVVPLNPTVRTELIRSVLFLAEDAVCVDVVMADLKMLPTLMEI